MKYAVQAVAYSAFIAFVAVLSVNPELRLLGEHESIISLSFSHATKPIGECKRLSQEEILALPPNMRAADECPRERNDMLLEFDLDGEPVYAMSLPPSGFWRDGKSTVYERMRVSSGTHQITIRMNDTGTPGQIDHAFSANVIMTPGENLVVHFDPAGQEFKLEQVKR